MGLFVQIEMEPGETPTGGFHSDPKPWLFPQNNQTLNRYKRFVRQASVFLGVRFPELRFQRVLDVTHLNSDVHDSEHHHAETFSALLVYRKCEKK